MTSHSGTTQIEGSQRLARSAAGEQILEGARRAASSAQSRPAPTALPWCLQMPPVLCAAPLPAQ